MELARVVDHPSKAELAEASGDDDEVRPSNENISIWWQPFRVDALMFTWIHRTGPSHGSRGCWHTKPCNYFLNKV